MEEFSPEEMSVEFQQYLDECVEDGEQLFTEMAIEDAIEAALLQEGLTASPETVKEGREMMMKEDEEGMEPEYEKPGLSNQPVRFAQSAGLDRHPELQQKMPISGVLSRRQKIQAKKEGLMQLLEEIERKAETRDEDTNSYYEEQKEKIERTLTEIDGELSGLPEDQSPENYDPQDKDYHTDLAKRAKKSFIKSMYSSGIWHGDKFGLEALGALTDEYNDVIYEASGFKRRDEIANMDFIEEESEEQVKVEFDDSDFEQDF